ncbi:MAG: HPr family phosphocarrier protein, partial [Bacteroidales bacterium]|nr:HPr family phosphocarrier protein [Bacteroidales bacterium]
MISKIVTISAPNGMHARPAGELVKLVKSLAPVKLTITGESKTVNAASMLSILSLGLKSGSQIV